MDLRKLVAYEIYERRRLTPLEINQAGDNFPMTKFCNMIMEIIEPLGPAVIGILAAQSQNGKKWLELGVGYSQNESGFLPMSQDPEDLGKIAFKGRGKYHALVGASISLFEVMQERVNPQITPIVPPEERLALDTL